MIAFVHGTVASVGSDHAVIDVGGVGLALMCGPRTLADLRPGVPARMATALVVREDSLTLFGFADEDERAAFEVLQSVTGIGPRTALDFDKGVTKTGTRPRTRFIPTGADAAQYNRLMTALLTHHDVIEPGRQPDPESSRVC